MKRVGRTALWTVFFLCCFLLFEKTGSNWRLENDSLVTESSLPYLEKGAEKKENIKVLSEKNEEETGSKTEEAFNDELKAELMRKQQDLYYFSNLEITEQNLYVEILYALENYTADMKVSTTDTAMIDKIFQCVLMDHPEIFYTDGYSFVKYTLGEEVQKITFKGTYIYSQEEKKEKEAQIQEAVFNILAGIEADATDYEKVKYVYETIIHQTEYDLEAEDNQNICSVLLNQKSVCQGYAKAIQYLLNKLNISAVLVIGTVETGEGHAWNLVKVNNQYYYLDATWGDASYRVHMNETEEAPQYVPAINYDYFCITTEEISRTHNVGDWVALPICDSMEANYYVREGAYFTEVNYEQLAQLFAEYKSKKRETVTIKCANDTVYQQMEQELLSKQKIFRFLEGKDNSIVYNDSSKQRSITFWL
mgnify:CR=1 FL=1